MQGLKGVKLLFRLGAGSARFLVDKKICKMIIDEKCIMRDNGAGDVEHLLVTCGEFDWWVLADDLSRIVLARSGWRNMEECKKGKVALLLGKGMKGVNDSDEGGVMYWIGSGGCEGRICCIGSYEQLDTAHPLLVIIIIFLY